MLLEGTSDVTRRCLAGVMLTETSSKQEKLTEGTAFALEWQRGADRIKPSLSSQPPPGAAHLKKATGSPQSTSTVCRVSQRIAKWSVRMCLELRDNELNH